MDTDVYPACGGSKVLGGMAFSEARGAGVMVFDPDGTAAWLASGVRLADGSFRCCSVCGHLWSRVDPDALRAYVKKHGDELIKQFLDLDEPGEGSGPPRTPEVAEASRKVREIDGLVRSGRQGEAARRFRELTATTWDRAIDATRNWRELTLLKKLDLCGWRPKGAEGDGGLLDHPMRDPLLDG